MSTGHSSDNTPNPPQPPPPPTEPHPHYHQQHFCGFVPQTWRYDGYAVQHNSDLPHISNLLLREAEAWRAVLNLHAATVGSAQQIGRSEDTSKEQVLQNDERAMNSDARESSYCCALTGLATQCDTLHSECLKLRALRKSRRAVEVQSLAEIVRSSSDEILAIGQSLASNASLNVSSATSELRLAIQHQRNQVSQLRALLDAVRSASSLPLPKGAKLMIGVQSEGKAPQLHGLDELLEEVYRRSRDLNETSLSDALSRVFVGSSTTKNACEPQVQARHFARRAADRGHTHADT